MNCFVKDCIALEENTFQLELEGKPFYPDGKGGQLGDRGSIGNTRILSVSERFVVVDQALEKNRSYSYTLDLERQQEIAQQHTAQHIFSALAYQFFQWNTVGFRMAEDYSTVDFDSQDLNEEKISTLEQEVNRIIHSNLPIKTKIYSSEEAHEKEASLQKKISSKIEGEVRMVEIPDVDLCACAGFHVASTLEISTFKIIYHESVKGKFTRFYFLAGKRALKDYQEKHKIIRQLCQKYSCKTEEILMMTEKAKEEKEILSKKYHSLLQAHAKFLAEDLKQTALSLQGKEVIFCDAETALQNALLPYIPLENYTCIFTEGEKITLHSQHWNCKEMIRSLTEKFPNIKGGGSEKKGNIKGILSQEQWLSFFKK